MDKSGVLRRLRDRWGRGPRGRAGRPVTWGWAEDRRTAEESDHGVGEGQGDGGRTDGGRQGTGGGPGVRGRQARPARPGPGRGARGGGRRGEAEAGRAAVFVELSAAVEL